MRADLILTTGRFTTLDRSNPIVSAVAISNGLFTAVGREEDVMRLAGPSTRIIDLKGRRVLPGLIDNHLHIIRGGLNFNMELRWDGVRSLSDAMAMLKRQVAVTPPPQWVRVVGGFTAHQFTEKRLPTIDELNAVAPDTPVFLLHLYDRAVLHAAALRAVGYTKDTPDPPAGEIVRDASGNPTGLLVAKPNAAILYGNACQGAEASLRLPAVIQKLHEDGQLTIRLAYNLFTQKPKSEKADFLNWTKTSKYKQGDDYFRHNGAGEMLVFSAADFEDFEEVGRILAQNRWPWRLHATYDETISRALDAFERVNQDIPLDGLNWFFDHAETISDESIERIAALGGGIAVQHRMAYQGEYFVERYGHGAAEATPPIAKILRSGVKISGGTDATRVASYNPWVALAWLVTGKTVAGMRLYPQRNCLDRETALRMWTENVTWLSDEEGKKGRIEVGQFADLIVPDRDYFSCSEEEIADTTSDLTIVGGKVVYAAGDFAKYDEAAPPPAMPDWSPVRTFGGYAAWADSKRATETALRRKLAISCDCAHACNVHGHDHGSAWSSKLPIADLKSFWGMLGCSCWAV
jgi:predicted amidohydrolase YtcJ